MSAVEPRSDRGGGSGVTFGRCAADIVEIGAHRGCADALAAIAHRRGLTLPHFGRIAAAADRLALCVRPERWLLLTAPANPGASAAAWREACAGLGAAIDLSSGLVGLHLAGAASREMLASGCRLDLDRHEFPVGRAAATVIAQVSVLLAALPSGLLLLTPSTTARHFQEWLIGAAQPFGLQMRADYSLADLIGSEIA